MERLTRGQERYGSVQNGNSIQYKGTQIKAEKAGAYWLAYVWDSEGGRYGWSQVPGQYPSEAEALQAAKDIVG